MAEPTYDIGDVVYIKESAALGHLEAAKIDSVSKGRSGEWVYTIATPGANPTAPSQFGDRKSFQAMGVLYFTDSELLDKCAALTIMEAYFQRQLTYVQNLKASLCE